MVSLNLLGLLYCTHAALPHLLSAAETDPRSVADIVNVSSVAGTGRSPQQRGLQRHQARRRRLQRVAPPGGDGAPRACDPH